MISKPSLVKLGDLTGRRKLGPNRRIEVELSRISHFVSIPKMYQPILRVAQKIL
jgi:hypothetical protein